MDSDNEKLDIDDILRKRYWLKQHIEWFIGEAIFHKEMKDYFKNRSVKLWHFGDEIGRAKISDETSFR